jgi:subtilisin family serine protease
MPRYNIKIDLEQKPEIMSALAKLLNARVVQDHKALNVLTVIAPSITSLRAIPGVELVETDKKITLDLAAEWHQFRVVSQRVPMQSEYAPKFSGEGSVVYLVDSGISRVHSELATAESEGRIVDLYSYDQTFSDPVGHGTAMAGLIVGETLGIAAKATIKNVKIPFGVITISELLAAFNAILDDAALTQDVKVASCSWVIPKSELLDTKILELQAANLVVVAAAGNKISPADDFSPVGLNTVIGVGASDAYDMVSAWGPTAGSNFGPEVDIFAPGIEVSIIRGTDEIVESSGTSNAAAIVSGVCTHLIQENPEFTAAEIQQTLLDQGSRDRLIRDESIYETTPNVMVYTKHVSWFNAWNTPNKPIMCKKGETTTHTLQPSDAIVLEGIVDYYDNPKHPYTLPSWAVLSGLTIEITPDVSVETKYYMGGISAPDIHGVIRPLFLTFGVYESDSIELDSVDENYRVFYEEDDTVLLVLSSCPFYDTCTINRDLDDCSGSGKPPGTGCGCTIGFPCIEM